MGMRKIVLIRKDPYGKDITEEYIIQKKEDKLEIKVISYVQPYLPSEYHLPEMTLEEFTDYLLTMYKGEEKDLVYQLLSKLIY